MHLRRVTHDCVSGHNFFYYLWWGWGWGGGGGGGLIPLFRYLRAHGFPGSLSVMVKISELMVLYLSRFHLFLQRLFLKMVGYSMGSRKVI